jgi:hypothetical protein
MDTESLMIEVIRHIAGNRSDETQGKARIIP